MKLSDQHLSLRSLLFSLSSASLVVLFAGLAQAQSPGDGDPATLRAARMVLATTDSDMDGLISKREADAAGIPEREFAARDKDKSGSWTGEEFLLYYHGLLKNSGKQPDKAFDDEVTRIEAVRRAQEEELRRAQERLRKQKVREEAAAKAKAAEEAAKQAAGADAGGETESIEEKLRRAREALKDRSKRAGSDRDAYERKVGELSERARGANDGTSDAGETAEEDWAVKLRRARAALERRAKEGRWSREQLEAADLRLIERARAAEQGVDLTQLPAPVRSKYERALVALSERAQSGGWSREKYEAELADLLARAKDELDNGRAGDPTAGPSAGELTQARRTYERALAALDERAKAGGWSRERYEAEREELAERLKIQDSSGDAGSSEPAGDETSEVRAKVERAQDALDERARRADMDRKEHQRISEELYRRARSSMNTELLCLQEEDPLRTKHTRAMEALIRRAQSAEMTRAAFESERDQLLQRARLAIEARNADAEAGHDVPKASQADFDGASDALVAAMRSAPADVRTKYGRAMLALIARAQKAEMSRAAFEHERDQLIARAKQEALAGAASQADFDAAEKSMGEVVAGQAGELRSKHQRAMNALISRAQDAGMSREAFERQRDELLSRARREARAGG
ncbi:MAG: hypothetical protein MK291_01080 [Planctomycetes bacterium]|nr:hypothetical protein [Planctomycetota bacterium]